MRIGELAERAQVSVRSLRYYEEQEMLMPVRTAGGQRVYDDEALDRVLLIQQLFAAGLSSKDVVELLPCVYTGTTTPEMIDRLRHERGRIASQILELTATQDRLDAVLAEATRRLERSA